MDYFPPDKLIYERDEGAGQLDGVSPVEDERDVEKGDQTVGEDEFVDESDGEVGGDPPQQHEVHCAQNS